MATPHIDSGYLRFKLSHAGLPIALVASGGIPVKVYAVLRHAEDRYKIRGLQVPEDYGFVPFQRHSADYWQRFGKHAGPLGWDRGVLVDEGLFPRVLADSKE